GSLLSKLSPFDNQFTYKKYMFDIADLLVVNSQEEGILLSRVFGANLEKKMMVVHNSISDSFEHIENKELFLNHFNIKN
ncbi:hypothetical protein, partial [Streptomyces brasiliscabiei]|uniref:hypothetical protein n=1 Tax=Streptomyces brasiliscabiei TaxID=2736302 RepID=UPI003014B685